jgi:hypothetical protein
VIEEKRIEITPVIHHFSRFSPSLSKNFASGNVAKLSAYLVPAPGTERFSDSKSSHSLFAAGENAILCSKFVGKSWKIKVAEGNPRCFVLKRRAV